MSMIQKKLFNLINEVEYLKVRGPVSQKVRGLAYDSRKVQKGDVYVAIRGEQHDGHDYIPEALNNGAIGVIGEIESSNIPEECGTYVQVDNTRKTLASLSNAFYNYPTRKLFVVGITGTNGKTTTAHMTCHLLGSSDNTEIISTIKSSSIKSLKKPVTTPDPVQVHKSAHKAINKGKRNFVIEVSSHGLEMERVGSVDFDAGIFTNLTRDHLDYHDSLREYGKAKIKLFKMLGNSGTAIVNNDDEFSYSIIKQTEAKEITYGLTPTADVFADNLRKTRSEIKFSAHTPWGNADFSIDLFGRYNVYNALPAITIGLIKGIDIEALSDLLSEIKQLPGRMERIPLSNKSDIFVDFAHNAGGLKESLQELKELYSTVIAIFGCGGQSDKGKRPEMGEVASRFADEIILTNDNPKTEDEEQIIKEIEEGIPNGVNYDVIPNRKLAIRKGLNRVGRDTALLIAGKGHEQYQIFKDKHVKYNDVNFVRTLLNRD